MSGVDHTYFHKDPKNIEYYEKLGIETYKIPAD